MDEGVPGAVVELKSVSGSPSLQCVPEDEKASPELASGPAPPSGSLLSLDMNGEALRSPGAASSSEVRNTMSPFALASDESAQSMSSIGRFRKAARSIMMSLEVVRAMRVKTFPYVDTEGRLPLCTKATYAAPSFCMLSLTMLITIHGVTFYESIGTSLTFIAFFTALARSFDVFSDPLMAWISDSTRTRWGRRKPYILGGCWGYAIAFGLLMSPPASLSRDGNAYWFGAFYLLFYVFDTIANIPWSALGPELTDSVIETESVYFTKGTVDKLGVLAGAAGPAVVGAFGAGERLTFTCLSVFFGVIYIVAMLVLVTTLKERAKSHETDPVPLVPSVLRAFKNIAFRPLLFGWILDFVALGLISSMVPFFVKFVVRPDDPDAVLGVSLGLLFVMSGASMPVWKKLSLTYGKRRVWLTFNLLNALTNFGFIFVTKGDVTLCYIMAALNGIPVGAQFLNEAIVSDVIDYDEFLNGTRSEGAFTCFANFIPKVISIPSAAVPLAILAGAGFVPSVDGEAQEQPDRVVNTIRIIFIIIPAVAMLLSFYWKLQYPMRGDTCMEQIHAGIVRHEAGQPAYDPITQALGVTILKLDEEEQRLAWLLDNFAWDTLRKYVEGVPQHLSQTMALFIALGSIVSIGVVFVIAFSFRYLDDPSLAWIPSFSCMVAGVALCFVGVSFLRYKAAVQLECMAVSTDLVRRIMDHKMRGQRGGDTQLDLFADNPSKFPRIVRDNTSDHIALDAHEEAAPTTRWSLGSLFRKRAVPAQRPVKGALPI